MSKRRDLIERRREQQRKQTLILLVVIGAIAVLVFGVAIILSNRPAAPITATTRSVPIGAEANARAWGPADAPIKVVEWLDYQCPTCGAYSRSFEAGIEAAFAKTGKVRYEVKSLSFIGQESVDAAASALCAADQDKFWQMHYTILENQNGENQGAFGKTNLKQMASAVGLDMGAFNTCLDGGKYAQKIQDEKSEGEAGNVNQTPTFVINGKLYPGLKNAGDMAKIFAEVAPDVNLTQ
jgi:protein-disulfide isomerase